MANIDQRFFKPHDAAKFCALSASTLAKRRLKGLPPEYRKVGRAVLYDIADLEKFLEAHRCRSTSEEAQP